MKKPYDYEPILEKLRNNHLYCGKEVNTKGEVLSLYLNCPPILKDSRREVLDRVMGDGFLINWMPNQALFTIKKK